MPVIHAYCTVMPYVKTCAGPGVRTVLTGRPGSGHVMAKHNIVTRASTPETVETVNDTQAHMHLCMYPIQHPTHMIHQDRKIHDYDMLQGGLIQYVVPSYRSEKGRHYTHFTHHKKL